MGMVAARDIETWAAAAKVLKHITIDAEVGAALGGKTPVMAGP